MRFNSRRSEGLNLKGAGMKKIIHQYRQMSLLQCTSDLAGLNTALYDWDRSDQNYKGAVGSARDTIREIVRDLGFSDTKVNTQSRAVQDEQVRQRGDLQTILRFLLENFVSEYEVMQLRKLASGEPFPFTRSDSFESELRRLLSLGLIAKEAWAGNRLVVQGW
jgi:hypothetical protein